MFYLLQERYQNQDQLLMECLGDDYEMPILHQFLKNLILKYYSNKKMIKLN